LPSQDDAADTGAVFAGRHADHQDPERTLGVAEDVVVAHV
jgi:hypothetical protein